MTVFLHDFEWVVLVLGHGQTRAVHQLALKPELANQSRDSICVLQSNVGGKVAVYQDHSAFLAQVELSKVK